MKKQKRIRERGKPKLSLAFQELQPGEKVAMLATPGRRTFPLRWHGRVAEVVAKQGRAYKVKFLNGKVVKYLVLKPINLKRLAK